MHVIDPNAIYTTEEVMNMLSGCVKLDTLRAHGRVSLPGAGYWGADLIFAINAMQKERRTKKYGKKMTADRGDHLRDQPRLLIIEQPIAMKDAEGAEDADLPVGEVAPPSPTSAIKRVPIERRQAIPNQKLKLRELAAKLKE
ncbi:MAG: hypothetical protein RLY93_06650 [Sumerlaeia bacterium]